MAPKDNAIDKNLQPLYDNEYEEEEQTNFQKQINKQINYNPFVQKLIT